MKLLFICLLISGITYGQKKDSLPPKPDSVTVLMNEFLVFLQDKVTVKEYLPVQAYVQGFLKEKEFRNPKKK